MRSRVLNPRSVAAALTASIIAAGCALYAADLTDPSPLSTGGHLSAAGTVELRNEPIQPVPDTLALDRRKVELGASLFNDKRLSGRGDMSCASCHRTDHGGADDAPVTALEGHSTKVNVPTIWNSRFSVAQFWDGRAATLEDQIDQPLQNPDEMAATWPGVIARLSADRGVADHVRAIYGTPLSPEVVKDAIATYERSLISLNSRFDKFLRGDEAAITPDEKRGYRLFKDYGCTACHQGIAVGGNMYQRMGLFGDYFGDRKTPEAKADLGRFNVTGNEADRHVFKVPSLRTAVLTAPYFHDGSAATLDVAIAVMGHYQLGREIPPDDVGSIKAFLGTLTGEPEGAAQ